MRNWMIRSVGTAVLASTLALTTIAAAASNMFLKVDGIEGESTAQGHLKEIEIDSFSWGFHNAPSKGMGGGAGASKATIQDFTVVKRVDASSPNLVRSLLQGTTIKIATFVVQRAGGKAPADSIKITLENVRITDIKVSGAEAANATESVSFAFGKLTYDYTPIDAKGGKAPTISVTWDVAKNKS
jgi:type VI secretion system secreted protein Hcp